MKQLLLILTLFGLVFGISGAQDGMIPDDETMQQAEEEMMHAVEEMAEEEMAEEEMVEEEMAEEEMVEAEEEMAMMSSSEPTAEEVAVHFLEIINSQSYEYTWHYEPRCCPRFL